MALLFPFDLKQYNRQIGNTNESSMAYCVMESNVPVNKRLLLRDGIIPKSWVMPTKMTIKDNSKLALTI